MESEIQYITDSRGHKKSVIISVKEWQLIQKEKHALQNKIQFLEELKTSVDQVKETLKGKRKTKALSDLLNEL